MPFEAWNSLILVVAGKSRRYNNVTQVTAQQPRTKNIDGLGLLTTLGTDARFGEAAVRGRGVVYPMECGGDLGGNVFTRELCSQHVSP